MIINFNTKTPEITEIPLPLLSILNTLDGFLLGYSLPPWCLTGGEREEGEGRAWWVVAFSR
jgi:hypothetical protein